MPRKPQVRYFASRKAYYCQIGGKQHKLAAGPEDFPDGPTYKKAIQAWLDLTALNDAGKLGVEPSCRIVVELYLKHIKEQQDCSDATFRIRSANLVKHFLDAGAGFRTRAVSSLRHAEIYTLCKDNAWGTSSVKMFLESLQACLNWAVKTKLIAANPMKDISTPSPVSRGADCIIDTETHAYLLKHVRKNNARQILTALHNTGARPSEIINATADVWDDKNGCLVYRKKVTNRKGHQHKSAKKKDRIILFTGEALTMMRELVKKHPTGYLFRTGSGGKWGGSLRRIFIRLRAKLKRKEPLTAYSYRHTFATNALKSGMPIDTLACLMGNTPTTIRHHYSHLLDDIDNLRKQLEAFRAKSLS